MAHSEFTTLFKELARLFSAGEIEAMATHCVERLVIYNLSSSVIYANGPEAVADYLHRIQNKQKALGVTGVSMKDLVVVESRASRAVIDVTWQLHNEASENNAIDETKYFLVKREDGWKISMIQQLVVSNQNPISSANRH